VDADAIDLADTASVNNITVRGVEGSYIEKWTSDSGIKFEGIRNWITKNTYEDAWRLVPYQYIIEKVAAQKFTLKLTGVYTPEEPSTPGRGSGTQRPPAQTPQTETPPAGETSIVTPSGEAPTDNGDDSVTLPGGGTATVRGGTEVEAPAGTVVGTDGSVRFPSDAGGTLRTPGGVSVSLPAGTLVESAGVVHIPAGGEGALVTYADGSTRFVPAGYTITDPNSPLASALSVSWTNPFGDVRESDWFYADVVYVCENGLMNGTSIASFSPQTPMTRGMIVTVLGRLANADEDSYTDSDFSDIEAGMYYTPYVAWAAANDLVSGMGDGLFAPDSDVTRQDLATLITRYADFAGQSIPALRSAGVFEDDALTADYAKDALRTLVSGGIINGKPGNVFDPRGSATRAEVAAILHRFMEATQ
jgi:hypothetical protein